MVARPKLEQRGKSLAQDAPSGLDARPLAPSKRRRELKRAATALGLQLGAVLLIGLAWQLSADNGLVNVLFTSRPTAVIAAFFRDIGNGSFTSPLLTTLYETLVGFGISVMLGVGASLLMYWVPLLHRATRGLVTAANNLPRLALAPLCVLWFGIGSASRIAVVVSMAFFLILINTYAGLQSAERDHLLLAKVLGAGRWKTFVTFVLPAAIPTIFAGLQLGLAFAFVGAVISEMIMGGTGLGAILVTDQTAYRTADVMALLVLMALVATAMSLIVRRAERRFLVWRRHEFRVLDGD